MNKLEKASSTMMKVALLINVIILLPVCSGLILDAAWIGEGLGMFSPARGILLSIYISIALSSVILFLKPDVKFIASLLFIQVAYKVTTPFTVGTIDNPVVISNLVVAIYHSVTLFLMRKSRILQSKIEP